VLRRGRAGSQGRADSLTSVDSTPVALPERVEDWARRRTHDWRDWTLTDLLDRKQELGVGVSLVVPARNEAATVGAVVSRVREALMETTALLDEVVVIDSDSDDETYAVATDAGAVVHRAAEIRADLGTSRGKGEAMWKSLFVTSGDLIVFMDADLVDWDTHFVPGLLGPLLTDPAVEIVKGVYQRPFLGGATGPTSYEGGRVTELVARPLLALEVPELAGLVQPLAGEWAVRRGLFASLRVPTGYGVEVAALIDTLDRHGLDAIAQVDLGRRAHQHQALRDLAVMSTQIQAAVRSRRGGAATDGVALRQFHPEHGRAEPSLVDVLLTERPPAVDVGVAS
jgi:glucosyl-3-phosphoglycerate synthase